MLISKFLASSIGKEIIPVHILLNITKSKDNQKMRFDQLVLYFFSLQHGHTLKTNCKKCQTVDSEICSIRL